MCTDQIQGFNRVVKFSILFMHHDWFILSELKKEKESFFLSFLDKTHT